MSKLDKILDRDKKQKILNICTKYGGYNVRIFGSYARGEATEKSDLDLLIDIKKGKSLFDRIALKQELEDFLGIKVDIAKPHNLHETIKKSSFTRSNFFMKNNLLYLNDIKQIYRFDRRKYIVFIIIKILD
jgi:predicted nucleotidyltransferase